MIRRKRPVRHLYGLFFFLFLPLLNLTAQSTTLVYSPDIQLGAGGPIRFIEERVDGDLTRRAELRSPGFFTEFIQKAHSDGSLRRLVWFYDTDEDYTRNN